ncbi:hypothetical protein [Rhizobium sp. PP-F2F-G48]|uniref:hypothetical protein n=1 Tax=Rhizobium sp. PP-F2F-G48 TaxID=2135651 RepID=UPI0010485FC4|nr:hypothetical protein [Rhizobium sp. PP-F2F-G48]
MTITPHDGRVFSATVYAPHGSAILGIKWEDVEFKYKTFVPMSVTIAAHSDRRERLFNVRRINIGNVMKTLFKTLSKCRAFPIPAAPRSARWLLF